MQPPTGTVPEPALFGELNAGHATAVQPVAGVKKTPPTAFSIVLAVALERYPALQTQSLVGRLVPTLKDGHSTTTHEPQKKGAVPAVPTIEPEYPALQMHPAGTLAPVLNNGQVTAVQIPV